MNDLKENLKLIESDLQKQLYDLKIKLIRTEEITDSARLDLCNDIFEVEKLVNNLSLYLVISSFYCQSEIEEDEKCDKQCEHCKEYYKPLENER